MVNAQDTGEDVEGDDVGLTGANTAWETGGEMESVETSGDVEGDDVGGTGVGAQETGGEMESLD